MTAPAVETITTEPPVIIPCDACKEPTPRPELEVRTFDLARHDDAFPGVFDMVMTYIHVNAALCVALSKSRGIGAYAR